MSSKLLGLFAFSIFAFVLVMGLASAATLANWNFETSTLTPSTDITGGATLTLSDSRTPDFSSGGNLPYVTVGMSSTGWYVADRYIELDLSTSGYENLLLRFDEQASPTGPTTFQIQYSSDGTAFTNLGSTTSTVSTFTTNPMHTFDFSTITVIDNNINTKLRIT